MRLEWYLQMNEGKNNDVLRISDDIEFLTKLHILYGLYNSDVFLQKKRIIQEMIKEKHINWRKDFNLDTQRLYRRYFG